MSISSPMRNPLRQAFAMAGAFAVLALTSVNLSAQTEGAAPSGAQATPSAQPAPNTQPAPSAQPAPSPQPAPSTQSAPSTQTGTGTQTSPSSEAAPGTQSATNAQTTSGAETSPSSGTSPSTQAATTADSQSTGLKIGIIGAGKIGGTLAELWAKAGHEVMISSRHPNALKPLASRIGPKARVGTPKEAAAYGHVVLISVPYAALPQVGRDYAKELAGKVVLDTGNPYPERDGDMAYRAREKGAGIASREFLPGVKLVRAFNAIRASDLRSEAHRSSALVAVPIAGDDADALEVASKLVSDAGFDPVVVGDLVQSRKFDVNMPVYVRLMSGPELRTALGLR